jgi:hypothetical protein
LLDALGSLLGSVAGDLLSKLHDDAMVDDTVAGGCGVLRKDPRQSRARSQAKPLVELRYDRIQLIPGIPAVVTQISKDEHRIPKGIKAIPLLNCDLVRRENPLPPRERADQH